MRIAIPDDYQDIVHRLKCFELLRDHEVQRFREPARDEAELAERLADAQVVVAIRERVAFPRSLLERLPKLELLALVGRHSKVIDFAACKDLGIDTVHGSNASPASPAELTLALILASRRNIATEAERMKRGELPRLLSHRLRGSTLGVFGLGTIGSLVAEGGAGFGMKILIFGRTASHEKARRLGYATAKSKAQLFEESDVLTLQVRLTPETRGSVTREDFARMKPSALFELRAGGVDEERAPRSVEKRASGLCCARRLRGRAGAAGPSAACDAQRTLHAAPRLGRVRQFRAVFRRVLRADRRLRSLAARLKSSYGLTL